MARGQLDSCPACARPAGGTAIDPAHPVHPVGPVRVLVVGYGNPLREDDGAGWHVADRVAERAGEAVRVLRLHQLTPEVSAELAEADLAIFVDARADDPDRGVEVTPVEPADGPARSHYCSPATLLATAQALFGAHPRAYLVSIPARSFGFAESLTPETRAAADEAVEVVAGMIEAWPQQPDEPLSNSPVVAQPAGWRVGSPFPRG